MKDWKKGSFTVEAAIIIPFFLFLMVSVLRLGILFYQDSCVREHSVKLEGFDAVSVFYKMQLLEKLGEEVVEDGL